MFRQRCRPAYTQDELLEIYQTPHDHTRWENHIVRVQATIDLGMAFLTPDDVTCADLSCGDAKVAKGLFNKEMCYLGDFAAGYEFQGPIEGTINLIPEVDVFFLCETLEHLDDPDMVLRLIRQKAKKLILSTPNLTQYDDNIEHYWAWDDECVRQMMVDAGWKPLHFKSSNFQPGYLYQIWGCI
jgi:hypothetical protein